MNWHTLRTAIFGAALAATPAATPVGAATDFSFASIDGGTIDLGAFQGRPVLVVNTASMCGFAGQFDDLQSLQDKYASRGLVVLAVPSNDFNQELASGAEVKEYCAVNFDLTLPMTEITHVKGAEAHPFYAWLRDQHGFTPGWNFNKVLIGPDGELVATWGAMTKPNSKSIVSKIEPLLN
jgi:glutathione peroxidase